MQPTTDTTSTPTARRHRINPFPPVTASTYTMIGNVLTPIARTLPRRLLGVWAHPDDEAYLSAELMRRVVAAGGEVVVLTATRGEKGTDDPGRYDRDEFGDERAAELRASLAVLGVDDVRFMGLRDGECDLADDGAAIALISRTIDEFAPDAIVTFGPDGMTYHPDHRAVSRWTTEAWRRSSNAELLYATVTHDWASLHGKMHRELGVYADCPGGRPASIGRAGVALECRLSGDDIDVKRRALAAHASQTTGLAELMGEATYRTWWDVERFRRPTAAELAVCPVPDWVHADEGVAALIGAGAVTAALDLHRATDPTTTTSPSGSTFAAAREGVRDITPMVIGVIPFGLAIGASIGASSLSTAQGIVTGPAILAGAAQLSAITMLDAGAAPLVIIVSALMINARLLLYSTSLAPWFAHEPLRRRLVLAIPVIDQLYFTCIPRFERGDLDATRRRWYYAAAGGWLASAWVASQAVAIVGGARLPDWLGLRVAAPLALAGLLAKSVTTRRSAMAVAVAAAVTALAVDLPFHSVVLVATLVAIATASFAPITDEAAS